MEPAGEGRDDLLVDEDGTNRTCMPQWGPLVSGGTTVISTAAYWSWLQPKWSPPVIGGATCSQAGSSPS